MFIIATYEGESAEWIITPAGDNQIAVSPPSGESIGAVAQFIQDIQAFIQ